ncbi:MAG: RAMP superfamily CRISPR-associated protein [Gammaproteobacteria bacterium]
MLKRKLCEARFEWKLTCEGPLLIADGRYEKPDNEQEKGKFPHKLFISRNDPKEFNDGSKLANPANLATFRFYAPGTSLRGPFRAQAERIIRSLLPETASPPKTACDPFDMDKEDAKSCSKRLDNLGKTQSGLAYKSACPACKLFGCTGTASRIQFTDANIEPGYSSVYRDMIGIDRFTGGVYQGKGGANMRFHALENTSFETTVTVVNFELWQLGLLAYVFRDFQEGLVPIGFGKTKGFGLVKGEVRSIVLTYPKGKCDGAAIQHLGSLVSPEEFRTYGLESESAINFKLKPEDPDLLSFYESFSVETDMPGFWAAVAPGFNRYLERLGGEAG